MWVSLQLSFLSHIELHAHDQSASLVQSMALSEARNSMQRIGSSSGDVARLQPFVRGSAFTGVSFGADRTFRCALHHVRVPC
jgi:hypothetical protein